jgi:uncharacterized protein YkwD
MTAKPVRRPQAAAPPRLPALLALLLVIVTAAAACEGDAAGAIDGGFGGPDAGGGGPVPLDVQEARRDLSRYFVDGVAVEVIEPVPSGHIPAGATVDQIEAIERVNWYRWKVGLLPIDLDLLLSQAAQLHCDCYVAHQPYGMSPHNENPAWDPPCMGAAPWDRTAVAGVTGWGISEVIAFVGSPTAAVDGWAATLYHRLPITDPTTKMCGYGQRTAGNPRINTMNCAHGNVPPDVTGVILFPWDGAKDVPISWDGLEDPQPPVPPGGYPSGPIITLTAPQAFITVTHALTDDRGNAIEHTFLDFRNDEHLVGSNTVSLYAHEPLAHDTTYTVALQLDLNDRAVNVVWSFTTLDNPFEY